MSKKVALITGITGQDGSYLSELLLSKGYDVHGLIRRSANPNTQLIDHIFDPEVKGELHYGDMTDGIDDLLYNLQPDEVYNLAAMSHVRVSFDTPIYTAHTNAVGPLRVLEGIRKLNLTKKTKFYQASSSEMFGLTPPPQSETTLFQPASPYGCAKAFAYNITKVYREGYGIFASNGILFNHESERRGLQFVTRKITRLAAKIKLGVLDHITLGNLEAKRDWGHSKDYMKAIHMIMQHDRPDDFCVSTGEAYSVREFFEAVFEYLDLDPYKYLRTSDVYNRPVEVPYLLGDPSKIKKTLGWEPEIGFKELVKLMVDNDLKLEKQQLLIQNS